MGTSPFRPDLADHSLPLVFLMTHTMDLPAKYNAEPIASGNHSNENIATEIGLSSGAAIMRERKRLTAMKR
jgi:hypothetical protein